LSNIKSILLTLTTLLLFTACNDKTVVTVYKKSLLDKPIQCMRLIVTPEDKTIRTAAEKLYPFSEDCDMTLEISYKSGIHCNSSYNAPAKATTAFPTSYLKMELRRGMYLLYSYYIDLTDKPDSEDIQNAMKRIGKDLKFQKK